jgi:hypothetical protein
MCCNVPWQALGVAYPCSHLDGQKFVPIPSYRYAHFVYGTPYLVHLPEACIVSHPQGDVTVVPDLVLITSQPSPFGRFRYKSEQRERPLEGEKGYPEITVCYWLGTDHVLATSVASPGLNDVIGEGPCLLSADQPQVRVRDPCRDVRDRAARDKGKVPFLAP